LLARDPTLSPFMAPGQDDARATTPGLTVDDITARFVSLSPDDTEDLRELHEAAAHLVHKDDWPPQAREQAQAAVTALGDLADGKSDDPDIPYASAIEAFSSLLSILEDEEEGMSVGPIECASAQPTVDEEAPAPVEQPVEATAEPELVTLDLEADPAMIAEFVTESLEHLDAAESAMLSLEADPSDVEAVNAVFRGFHTIKGTAGFMGMAHVQRLAHLAESLLDRVREGEVSLTGGYADLALESADMLRQMTVDIGESPTGEIPTPPNALDDLLARLKNPEAVGISSDSEDIIPPTARLGDILVAEGAADREAAEKAVASADALPIGEKLVKAGVADVKDVAHALREQKPARDAGADATVRVRTDRLDNLINMVGELVVANAMLSHDDLVRAHETDELGVKVSQISKVTRELQSVGMSMRMVPLRATFQKMARAVRDLARKADKSIEFVTEGEDTEIDRNMVESLGDPLMHMIRNAVDHGIESAQEREASGKPATGTVTLRAYHDAGSVVIEIQDDGKGLDRDKILEKAVANGTVPSGRQLTDAEVFKLVFQAGLSTAEVVTDVSGRGVGMDVVRRNIEAVRGRIEIASSKGEGSTFALRIPLTLAIIDGMLLRVGAERYVIPTISVQEAFVVEENTFSTFTGRGEMVLFRDELVFAVRLRRLLAGGHRAEDDGEHESLVVIAEHDGELCALVVDELLGQQQIVIKSLGQSLGDVPGVSGAAIMGDGRVGLILDIGGILTLARAQDSGRQSRFALKTA